MLSETTLVNTTILRVHATDADIGLNSEITYDFTDASQQLSTTFSIDKQTGVVRLRASLDYEQRTSYVFYIQARDSGQESRVTQTLVNITVRDENDCAPKIQFRFLPEIVYHPSKDLIEISESHPIDKFFAQIIVTDEDSDERGRVRLWFEIIDEHQENDRSFHLYPIDNSTYFFNRTKPFDFETQQWHRLIFYAQDYDRQKPLQTNQVLTIHVLDENDNYPRFLHSSYHLTVNENNQENLSLTQVVASDPDSGENGRLTYDISTNETSLPFYIDTNTGTIFCSKPLDRENRSRYDFHVIVRDHGSPLSLTSEVHVRVDVNDVNDNQPSFEDEKYAFAVEENVNPSKAIGMLRVFDRDLDSRLVYAIEYPAKQSLDPFRINQNGELFLRYALDRETLDVYRFLVTVSDGAFRSTVPVTVKVLDVNDCVPKWKKPSENNTVLIVNKDQIKLGSAIVTLEAVDDDDVSLGNGLVSYTLEEIEPLDEGFVVQSDTGALILNSTTVMGRFRLSVRANDHGRVHRYSSTIQFYVLVGDNNTNASLFYEIHPDKADQAFKLNAFAATRRVLLVSSFFISIAIILAFIVCAVLILLCRYRRQKYLYYIKCKAAEAVGSRSSNPTMIIVENRLTNYDEKTSSSNSSKLSLVSVNRRSTLITFVYS